MASCLNSDLLKEHQSQRSAALLVLHWNLMVEFQDLCVQEVVRWSLAQDHMHFGLIRMPDLG